MTSKTGDRSAFEAAKLVKITERIPPFLIFTFAEFEFLRIILS